jgi:hypothetical protein
LKFQLGSRAPQHPGEFQEIGKSLKKIDILEQ